MICKRCGSIINIEKHHIHCRFMDNKKGYGKTINLCKDKCHIPLHLIISSILWSHIKRENKIEIIKKIEFFTEKYIDNYYKNDKKNHKDLQLNEYLLNKEETKICPCCQRTDIDIEDSVYPYCYLYTFGEPESN